jgi:hypothetical protein
MELEPVKEKYFSRLEVSKRFTKKSRNPESSFLIQDLQ